MNQLPSLPVIQANLNQKNHLFALKANAGWQTFPVPLRPLEEVHIKLSGEIVYHYREWTTSGACGKQKNHVERLTCRPDEDVGAGVFGLADADTAEAFARLNGICKPNLSSLIGDADVAGRREGRLAGILRACFKSHEIGLKPAGGA
ncbi:hypothetical protein LBMAG56_34280 [Verrucomicrobiota bacterium]|nr:hypothetical protein LBMAG56_34280 [Verrucomicrobiota bacterium]